GTRAIYWQAAPDPHYCISTGACSLNASSSLEASTGLVASCATDEDRWALSNMRALWDLYDTTDDPGFTESTSSNYYDIIDSLGDLPAGTGDGDADEPWNADYSALDHYDGRSMEDLASRFTTRTGASSTSQLSYNC